MTGGGARPYGAGSWQFSKAAAPKPLRRAEQSPPPAPSSGMNAWPKSSRRDRGGTHAAAAFLGPRITGSFARCALPPARHPLPPRGLRAQPAGKGQGRGVRTRTSERPARPAEPQAGDEQGEAAGPEPPHSAAADPRPALAPRGRRATCASPSPPAAPTHSLARGAAPNQLGGWAGAGRVFCNLQLLGPIVARLHCEMGGAGRAFPSGRRRNQMWLVRGAQCPSPCGARSAMELSERACDGDK